MAKPTLPAATTAADVTTPAAPIVRLEVRSGLNRPTLYEVDDGGFLIGSAPGCDLRLPGINLPPVLCLITRHANGASLRKLAPVQPVTVNGIAISTTPLQSGDTISLGSTDIVVQLTVAKST